MNPREVIAHVILMGHDQYPTPDDFADAMLVRLKAEGLFVGPIVATPDMCGEGARALGCQRDSCGSVHEQWDSMVEEWLRTEGA